MLKEKVKDVCEKGHEATGALNTNQTDKTVKNSSNKIKKCILILKNALDCYNFKKFLHENHAEIEETIEENLKAIITLVN
jgi:N-acetylmuramic acid 6-phosphate (MurNAc-6-P) etherase